MNTKLSLLGAATAVGLVVAVVSAQVPQGEAAQEAVEEGIRSTPMGPICWAAIVEVAYQTSARCDLGEDAGSQATAEAYSDARDALAERFLANGWTRERLTAFRAQQGKADLPDERLCDFDRETDTGQFIVGLANTSPEDISQMTDEMLEREGEPVWGTCL